jgi:hypothetical protein
MIDVFSFYDFRLVSLELHSVEDKEVIPVENTEFPIANKLLIRPFTAMLPIQKLKLKVLNE